METAFWLSACTLALSVLAAVGCIVTATLRQFPPDLTQLKQQQNATANDLTDLSDRVHQWMRRDSTRRARAARELPDLAPSPEILNNNDRKAALRARLRGVAP